ncbi:MAG: hypothetical protein ACI8WB_003453 [Phenylobacterium sp.]|jgi:hypothetical protein
MSLRLGDVLYRWVNFAQNPHHKFFVLVAKKPTIRNCSERLDFASKQGIFARKIGAYRHM